MHCTQSVNQHSISISQHHFQRFAHHQMTRCLDHAFCFVVLMLFFAFDTAVIHRHTIVTGYDVLVAVRQQRFAKGATKSIDNALLLFDSECQRPQHIQIMFLHQNRFDIRALHQFDSMPVLLFSVSITECGSDFVVESGFVLQSTYGYDVSFLNC